MRLLRFEPGIIYFIDHRGIHYATEANGMTDKNNIC